MDSLWHYHFLVIMLGDATVRKSSLLKHCTEVAFLDSINQTVGVNSYFQVVEIEPGLRIKL